jgi:hypothetical protein
MAVVVCFKVLVFDPKTTIPPITAAIAPIRTVRSNPTAPIIIANSSGSNGGFWNENNLPTPLYHIGKLLNVGFEVQDLFVQVTGVIHV